ncbi:MAG: ABC transporter permease [Candidatus Omnitrophica bacterium]|nr:ABC transporter permease [Candidatus Omnitrophota bacterium]
MVSHLKELYRFRDLLLSLAIRDIKVRYRQSLLGIAWAILQPLAFMAIFTLVFSKFGRMSSDGIPYPVFSYTGLVPWVLFATAISLSVNSVAANMGLVKKIYFPREVFPLGVIIGCLVDFLIASILVGVLMSLYKLPVTWQILWLPWIIAIEIGLLVGISLITSAVNVFYRDVKYILPIVVQLGLFVTPVIYSSSSVPSKWRPFYMLNPMAVVIENVRKVVLHGQPPEFGSLLCATAIIAIFICVAYLYFKRAEVKFADLI